MLRFGQLEIDFALREVRTPQTPLPVVGRSFDILVHLVRGNGEIVTKESILQSVWGSVQTRENSLHVHISALRKALGEHGDIKTISGVGYQLLPKLSQQKPSAESLTNLPLETSGLIGQDASLATVSTMLREHRIVTLTGPGGIGKTRLALAVARKLMQNYSDGTWVVQLASIVDGELVSSTLTATLGLDHFGSDLPSDRIAKALGSKQVLIVLDNCEHVIGAAANLAEKIIYATKSARILATSREALAIEGERVYHVPSLESPPVSNELDVPGLLGHSAVELFLSRAGQARAAYSRDIRALTAISVICRQLDGLPLAIELAAARVAFLGLAEVQDRLADRFNLLNNGRRTALPRQQTLRATLEWSYVLLSEPSRAVLRPLAVFAADFTLEAACAVAQTSGLSRAKIIEEISALVAKSLIEPIQKGSRHTYRLLESTRYYVMERLLDDGEGQAAKRNHAQFHL